MFVGEKQDVPQAITYQLDELHCCNLPTPRLLPIRVRGGGEGWVARASRRGGSPVWGGSPGWVARDGSPGVGRPAGVGRPGWVPKFNDLLNKFIDLSKNSM